MTLYDLATEAFPQLLVKVVEAGEVVVTARMYNAILTIGEPGSFHYDDQW